MKKRKRRIRYGRLTILIIIVLGLLFLLSYLINKLIDINDENNKVTIDSLVLNDLNYDDMAELELNLYSNSYMLIRLNDFKVLYGKNIYNQFYPASLAKVMTLDTVVSNIHDLSSTSYLTDDDYNLLIEENASLAGLKTNYNYSINDLLYALILPSGGDSALALENYFENEGKNLIDLMNNQVSNLNLNNSHFTNTTGLHNNNLYTSLDDYARIVIDCLLKSEAKSVLKTIDYTLNDGTEVSSTLSDLPNLVSSAIVYGGKTGFTGEAGENIMTLFSCNNRSYLLILQGADGNPYNSNEKYHIYDASSIIEYISKGDY